MIRFRRSISGAPWSPSPGPPSSLRTGYRHLAARVIHQAFRDLENPGASPEHRLSPRMFLTDSSILKYWCELAQTDSARVVARAKAHVHAPRDSVVRRSTFVDSVLMKPVNRNEASRPQKPMEPRMSDEQVELGNSALGPVQKSPIRSKSGSGHENGRARYAAPLQSRGAPPDRSVVWRKTI